MNRTVALIPARGGSKGIPRKNLALVAGRPLIAFTIEAAKGVDAIDQVYVSSDDAEILDVARQLACTPVHRPAPLAQDASTAVDVVSHFIDTELADEPDGTAVLYLQPTSPLRTARHIAEALDCMRANRAHAVTSVTEMTKSPFKSFLVDGNGELASLFDPELSNANRQSLPKAYIPNGAIYGFLLGVFRRNRAFPSNGSAPYVMTAQESVDVDTASDLARIKSLMENDGA